MNAVYFSSLIVYKQKGFEIDYGSNEQRLRKFNRSYASNKATTEKPCHWLEFSTTGLHN